MLYAYVEAHAIHLKAGDEITLQYLGAALVLQWHNLPEKAQKELIQQAMSVGGLPPVVSLHDQIKALIGRTKD
jgi:hypothetical protein